MLNMLEHMPAFLTLFWLNAVFVGTTLVSVLGALYVATRIAYPFLMGPEIPPRLPLRLLVSTYTGYAVMVCLGVMLSLAWVRA